MVGMTDERERAPSDCSHQGNGRFDPRTATHLHLAIVEHLRATAMNYYCSMCDELLCIDGDELLHC